MAAVEMRVDLSTLVDALVSGNSDRIISVARDLLLEGRSPDVLLGRIGLIASHGDPDGHPTTTLAAAAMLARLTRYLPEPLDSKVPAQVRTLPLFAQALLMAVPAVRAGHDVKVEYPHPFFPSQLVDTGKSMNDIMHQAVYQNDADLAERALLGLYGTGADYRTMQVRAYESIATTFQDAGHPLIFAVRGFQILDAVEWGDRAPNIIHWLAPHLPLRSNSEETPWIKAVRNYTADPSHSVASIRTRLSAPKDENALPLRQLILSNADTTQVCQGVYDALIKGQASPRAVGSVITLAASDLLQKISDSDRDLFTEVAHGLLFASATHLIFRQVQDVEALPILFTAASYINALQKEITLPAPLTAPGVTHTPFAGGGLIAVAQLESINNQLKAQDLRGALVTAQRYLSLGHDARALFGSIALVAGRIDATADQGHSLQILQAAAESYLTWPTSLASTNIEGLLSVALRAAAFGQADTAISHL
ncbi:hypothetical protein [Tengunoibacter tsumagoiensis]|uniref:Uncharacterized protein n=1 Tax=Tengunoibacter tsumagoiensis TaxID=2014871 RepID=A0A402A211_9CHLR|nr:hypothetical protein [Tengunoibacter tsumagoiensis]GCE13096.1 hypothetical protein KTT_29550 [Tengunoibacter tsumagoiensis]